MEKILNLTQHQATKEQIEAGVIEPQDKKAVQNLLTFEKLPDSLKVQAVANTLAGIAQTTFSGEKVLIGGAPFLMKALHDALVQKGFKPVYAFSKRVSTEKILPDGSIEKKQVFKHEGFVSL